MAQVLSLNEADILPGAMKAFRVGNINVLVFRLENGEFSALQDRCSHAEVKLSAGVFSGCEVECPAHGARFDVRSGEALCMPAVTPVKSYKTTKEGGVVTVHVE